jgi:hypothetical protein
VIEWVEGPSEGALAMAASAEEDSKPPEGKKAPEHQWTPPIILMVIKEGVCAVIGLAIVLYTLRALVTG